VVLVKKLAQIRRGNHVAVPQAVTRMIEFVLIRFRIKQPIHDQTVYKLVVSGQSVIYDRFDLFSSAVSQELPTEATGLVVINQRISEQDSIFGRSKALRRTEIGRLFEAFIRDALGDRISGVNG
jgi:hypothetical protein